MPFMALYIEELGVKGDMVEWYAGLSVAISALASAWFLLFGDAWLTVMVESHDDQGQHGDDFYNGRSCLSPQCFLVAFLENAEWFVCGLCPKCHSINC